MPPAKVTVQKATVEPVMKEMSPVKQKLATVAKKPKSKKNRKESVYDNYFCSLKIDYTKSLFFLFFTLN